MKRILALVLVLLLALSVCACGGNGNGAVNNDDNGGTPSNSAALTFKATATATNPTVMGTFYRNVVGQNFNIDNAAVKEVDKKADAMLKKIEEYPDTVKAAEGCKTYYISNTGKDTNDGLTPETARATYLAVKSALKPGDCVLFERGGLWRGKMELKTGVSYGAYGEGIKPRFYGSIDASKNGGGIWDITDTANVYVFTKIITDYSNIVFNNGEAIGRPVQKMEAITERELNVVYKSGKVYLYCPQGNPADVFETIEIAEGYTLIGGDGSATIDENVHVQNFCVMFAGLHGIGTGQCKGFEMDGCVIGYIGGKELYLGSTSIGNGLEMWGNVSNARIHDNYVFQCFDAGLTHQSNQVMKYNAIEEDIEYRDNLIEYCIYSIEAFVSTEHGPNKEYHDKMGKVTITGNICRFAGWGWGYLDRPDKGGTADIKYKAGDHAEPLVITGNIFDRAKLGVFRGTTVADKSLMYFTNNTVLLNPKRKYMDLGGVGEINLGADLNAFMARVFTDFSGTTITEVPNK